MKRLTKKRIAALRAAIMTHPQCLATCPWCGGGASIYGNDAGLRWYCKSDRCKAEGPLRPTRAEAVATLRDVRPGEERADMDAFVMGGAGPAVARLRSRAEAAEAKYASSVESLEREINNRHATQERLERALCDGERDKHRACELFDEKRAAEAKLAEAEGKLRALAAADCCHIDCSYLRVEGAQRQKAEAALSAERKAHAVLMEALDAFSGALFEVYPDKYGKFDYLNQEPGRFEHYGDMVLAWYRGRKA